MVCESGWGFWPGRSEPLLCTLPVCCDKLQIDDFHIVAGIDRACDMVDIFIIKNAYHFENGVNFANVRQELITQALSLRGALYETSDIDEFHNGGHFFGGFAHFRQSVEPQVWNGDDADRRINSGKGIIGNKNALARQRIKKRQFPDVR